MGIPVPDNKKHVIYVWLDALTNYLSALNFPDLNNNKYKSFGLLMCILEKIFSDFMQFIGQPFY